MGCCCNEEEEEPQLLQPLINPDDGESQQPSSPSSSESTHVTISPMNSNFSALLCQDTLRAILERLPLSDLARSAGVCRLWNSVASDREMLTRAFKSPWKIKDVIGNPSSGSFWRDNGIYKFAISHRLRRGDTVVGLAVRYSVQV